VIKRPKWNISILGDKLVWPRDKLTRFEVARLIGARALQISLGAPILVKRAKRYDPIDIAKEEFKKVLIPITIKRRLPGGEEVVVDVKAGIKDWLRMHGGEI
jgi:DNA-directed RNA polymerase subunit K